MGENIMPKPKVSVVIPIWNTEKYLEKCLTSIVDQTLKDIEIICVDNGSTDSCHEIIESFAKLDSRIKIVRIEHGYLSDARNKGVEFAQGEYLYFCDSDDWLESEALEVWYTKSKKHDADLCILQERRFNQTTKKYENIKYRSLIIYACLDDKIYKYIDMQNIFFPRFEAWLHFYKREFFIKENLFYPSKTFYEDVIIHFKSIFLAKKIVFSFEPLYNYRLRNDSSLAKSHQTSEKLDAIIFIKDLYYFLKDLNLIEVYLYDYINMVLQQMTYHTRTASFKYRILLVALFRQFIFTLWRI